MQEAFVAVHLSLLEAMCRPFFVSFTLSIGTTNQCKVPHRLVPRASMKTLASHRQVRHTSRDHFGLVAKYALWRRDKGSNAASYLNAVHGKLASSQTRAVLKSG